MRWQMSERSRPHRRRAVLAVPVTGALILGVLVIGGKAGLRINATASMPRGLWAVHAAARSNAARSSPSARPTGPTFARQRAAAISQAGICPGGYEPLLKPVAAVAGDLVAVAPHGIAVDGKPVANTRQLARDEVGRRLHPVPAGSYQVAPGQVWLLSGHDPRSFDSRYFGPVPIRDVTGQARPLWVLR